VADRSGGWDEDLSYFEVDPGYWDDDLRGREDDVYAAELYGYPFTPLELLYRRGAEEHRSLEELSGAWLSEISRVGLPEHDTGAPLLEKAGLPSIRFHDLRHTCATLLLVSNVNPKIVSEMLGHATIAIALDTYSHVLPSMQGGATRALEDILR
jgi:integrase-like protein